MGKIVKFPVTPPEKLGARKVRQRKKDKLEEYGQLNLFDPSRIISFHQTGNFFEEALTLDEQDDPRAAAASASWGGLRSCWACYSGGKAGGC